MTSQQTTDSFQSTVNFLEQVHQSESALPLRNEACRSKFFLHSHATPKVCLFFHGFTAGPYQFGPIGQAFFDAGYNVLVPLLPGHGQAGPEADGNWNHHNPPPLPTDIETYKQFVLKWLQIAKSLGQKVIVGGLSTGGTLAAWLALEHPPQIDRALLFTPYLGSRYKIFDLLIEVLPIYFEWFNKDASGNFGYKGFKIPALRVLLDLGERVSEQAKTWFAAPVLVVCSEGDEVVDRSEQQEFFKNVLERQPKAWYYCFDESLNINHRMMTKLEDNEHEELVITLAKAFVDSDLTWVQFQELATRMVKGITLKNIETTLSINRQQAEQLEAMMTRLCSPPLKCIIP
jgi:alpha-beta hydrolase superfamily lysophospholipase